MPRALFSVYDKTGLVEFARGLVALGWELIASGGTAKALTDANLPVTTIEQITGHPEMLGGRVKTLHPAIHAAILARDNEQDLAELRAQGYQPIDMVVSNLYPFEDTVSKADVTLDDAIENIDIGGVTLLRAAAKNFQRVMVVMSVDSYAQVLDMLSSGAVDLATRQRFAAAAFTHTHLYDHQISDYLHGWDIAHYDSQIALRYGENPHQHAQFRPKSRVQGFLGGELLGGKELSYNNLLDLDAAYSSVEQFEHPTAIIVKHLSPIGIASDVDVATAFTAALAADPVSAFGGVIALNREVDEKLVAALGDLFVEVLAAPSFTDAAVERLRSKRKNCRLMKMNELPYNRVEDWRSVRGGILLQTTDYGDPDDAEWRVVTKRQPTDEEMAALKFAWKACQFVKSNAIVIAQGEATVGIGGGLPSRVDAVDLAVKKAGDRAHGAVLASDAFFPFSDGPELAIRAGVKAIIEPGGSVRDAETIAACDAAEVAMIFTGVRHFRH